nr:MAG TPA: hypothetical protein [Caudoviricetes sp.]
MYFVDRHNNFILLYYCLFKGYHQKFPDNPELIFRNRIYKI